MGAVFHHLNPIYEYVLDPGRELVGIFVSRVVLHGCRIEYHHVGVIAGQQGAATTDLEVRGWQPAQAMDRVSESNSSFARVLADHAGKIAIGARVRF